MEALELEEFEVGIVEPMTESTYVVITRELIGIVRKLQPDLRAHTWNPSTRDAGAGRLLQV